MAVGTPRLITPCHTEPQDASQGIGFLQYSVWIVHHTWFIHQVLSQLLRGPQILDDLQNFSPEGFAPILFQ